MPQEKTESGKVVTGAHELSKPSEYWFPGELPKCKEAIAKLRRNEEHRIISRGEIIPLDKRQDLLYRIFEANRLPLDETEHIDVYNPAVIVTENGEIEFLGRAEGRSTKFSTLIVHFRLINGVWTPQGKIAFHLEDPAIAYIDNQIVVAGVKLRRDIRIASADYKTVFYKGTSLDDLERLKKEGPPGMKDIRLVKLRGGKIGVYTRPQGLKGGLGQIGFTTINSLDDLNEQVIQNAPLINARFPEDEWGGANQAQLLPDGRVFVLGHRAYRDEKRVRHYFPWAFVHDPATGEIQDLGILTESANFPNRVAKAWDLQDVLFPAGFILKGTKLTLYTGTRDTGTGKIAIENFQIPPVSTPLLRHT